MDTRVELAEIRLCPVFAGLPEEELASVASHAQRYTALAHRDVFVEGQRCDGLWMLVSGRVRLYHTSTDGRQHVVGFHAAGSTLELGPALDGRPFSVSANAPEGASLLFLPRGALLTVSRQPAVVRGIIDQLCLELRQLDIAAAIAALKDARGRIYCTLLRLVQQFGVREANGHVRIQYRLTRQDTADVAGVTLETAIRILSELTREGLVHTDARLIEIEDLGLLQQMAACGDCQLSCGYATLSPAPPRTANPTIEAARANGRGATHIPGMWGGARRAAYRPKPVDRLGAST